VKHNYAFKPIAELALRSNQTIVPQRLNAALDFKGNLTVNLIALIAFVTAGSVVILNLVWSVGSSLWWKKISGKGGNYSTVPLVALIIAWVGGVALSKAENAWFPLWWFGLVVLLDVSLWRIVLHPFIKISEWVKAAILH
jgi:hypothetical protein